MPSASLYTLVRSLDLHSTPDTYLDTFAGAVGSFVQNPFDCWRSASISYSLPTLVFCGNLHYLVIT
ncbi:MAG: hypothetical protein LH628_18635 [Microcoleus sp. CAN_BIN18]|nr:hypothetical protein [Microcoleus sp. CAN_BIN18]